MSTCDSLRKCQRSHVESISSHFITFHLVTSHSIIVIITQSKQSTHKIISHNCILMMMEKKTKMKLSAQSVTNGTHNMDHACLLLQMMIYAFESNRIEQIDFVSIGDRMLTHTHDFNTVLGQNGQSNYNKIAIIAFVHISFAPNRILQFTFVRTVHIKSNQSSSE